MLKEILSPESCAECRICCVFDAGDSWEMPLIEPCLADEIQRAYPNVKMKEAFKNGRYKIFDAEYASDGLTRCPMLTEAGCALGDRKPFDCKIWPFRVMKKGGCLLLTLSPVCETVYRLPINKASDFAAKISSELFEEAMKNPEAIKEYVEGYAVFAVKEAGQNQNIS